jgi:hypothetical protein
MACLAAAVKGNWRKFLIFFFDFLLDRIKNNRSNEEKKWGHWAHASRLVPHAW